LHARAGRKSPAYFVRLFTVNAIAFAFLIVSAMAWFCFGTAVEKPEGQSL